MKAIDLYSGIGGWTLGLQMAGVDTSASYEWWAPANETHRLNFASPVFEVDIRGLDAASLPTVDFIVGSPPCTQFSFANRGGSGDIEDGLRDVRAFLSIVKERRPRGWAMENVPRVADILVRELARGGRLEEFADLVRTITIVDAADYGVPQHRRRMIAGDFPLQRLESYKSQAAKRTLGDVVDAFQADVVVDPVYGHVFEPGEVTGTDRELPLRAEELRMNRDAKRFHPVYNLMSFPDRADRPARTITATCTRVSRESIVIGSAEGYRRLSVRERASLQGFPVGFALAARTYPEALKMIGNAVPPLLAYYIGHALLGTKAAAVGEPSVPPHRPVGRLVPVPKPDIPRRTFPVGRRFRAAIPHLRFGSGVRFELVNDTAGPAPAWTVQFIYGSSKKIGSLVPAPSAGLLPTSPDVAAWLDACADARRRRLAAWDGLRGVDLQDVWRGAKTGVSPYDIVDGLGHLAQEMLDEMPPSVRAAAEVWASTLLGGSHSTAALRKVRRNADAILVGVAVAVWMNAILGHAQESDQAPDADASRQALTDGALEPVA